MRTPLSAEDLAAIINQLRAWENLLVREGDYTPLADLVSRIEVHRPDFPEETVGHFVLIDGWVGFQPIGGIFA